MSAPPPTKPVFRPLSGVPYVPYHVYIVEPPTLLDDLLEDSARVFHHHCVIIQRVFHERWLTLVGEMVGKEQIDNPDANPAKVGAHVRGRLRECRVALHAKRETMVQEERDKRTQRDA